MNGYEQWAPPEPLAHAVDAFWCFTSPAAMRHRILPDGCTDLIFHLRDSRLVAVGPMERFALVGAEPGDVSVGVRFKPGWTLPLLEVSPRELCNLSVPVADCAPAFTPLQRRLADCRSPQRMLALFQDAVTRRMASLRHAPTPRTHGALRWLQSSGGQVRMATLAKELGMSERTLHRGVLDEAGVPPKFLARVLRFQRALSQLRAGADLSAVALECGYADQAHLTREVRELSGVTPTALL